MSVEQLVKYKLLNTPAITNVVAKSKEGIPLIEINKGFEGSFPHITLLMENGRDNGFADDETYSIYDVIKVNFYCKGEEFFLIQQALNHAMRDIHFFRINYYSVPNPSTNVHQFSIYYRTTLTTKMLRTQYTEQYMQLETPESSTVLPDGEYFDPESNQTYWIIDGQRVDIKP